MPEISPSKYLVMAGWKDVPHIDERTQAELLESTPPHLRDARSKGIPSLGSGAIYPVPESEITVSPFEIPRHWAKVYGMDVGWNRTAVVWGAIDKDSGVTYLYSEHYQGQAEPSVHAEAIKGRGKWIPGVIDPASRGRSQHDGIKLFQQYKELGLDIHKAKNSVEAGLYAVWQDLSSGKLKIFNTLHNWLAEYRIYRRDESGQVIKEHDHCLHGGTKVITSNGAIEIKHLVGTSGYVLSRDGTMERYTNCRMTRRNADVVKLVFSDGYEITCTDDHLFLSVDGWVKAGDLIGVDCYNWIPHVIQESIKCKSLLSQEPHKSLTELLTTFAGSIFKGMGSGFTVRYGSISTDIFQKASMFTTGMKTGLTIILIILNLKRLLSTSASTIPAICAECRKRQLRPRKNGTEVMTALNGISIITKKIKISFTKSLSLFVNIVERNLLHKLQVTIASVQMPVRHVNALNLALTMSNGIVLSVEPNSPVINTSKRRRVPANVARLSQCVSVTPAGKADVYCMDVPTKHAFAVENGVIVHNCMDATRYLRMSGLSIAKPYTPPQNYNVDMDQIRNAWA